MELSKLCEEYGYANEMKNYYGKDADKYSKQIKQEFEEKGISTCESDTYKLELKERESTTFNEEKLTQILNKYELQKFTYTKLCIDYDKLEDAIYKEDLTHEQILDIRDCLVTKVTKVLTCKNTKKK